MFSIIAQKTVGSEKKKIVPSKMLVRCFVLDDRSYLVDDIHFNRFYGIVSY